MVKMTDVTTKPSRDKCDRGTMWETRQPLTALEVLFSSNAFSTSLVFKYHKVSLSIRFLGEGFKFSK